MNEEIKERWLARLESGEIKQTRQYLGRPSGSRCCLGVLCDIAVEDGIIDPPVVRTMKNYGDEKPPTNYLEYDGQTGGLPQSVVEWAGLNNSDEMGEYYDKDGMVMGDLATRNDTSKYNFKKIAKIVREYF